MVLLSQHCLGTETKCHPLSVVFGHSFLNRKATADCLIVIITVQDILYLRFCNNTLPFTSIEGVLVTIPDHFHHPSRAGLKLITLLITVPYRVAVPDHKPFLCYCSLWN